MDERLNRRMNGRIVLGLMLIALGAMWTLGNIGLPGFGAAGRLWPVLPLLFGVLKLAGIGVDRSPVAGGFFTVLGSLLLLGSLHVVPVGIEVVIPLSFVFIGIHLLRRGTAAANDPQQGDASSDWVRAFAALGAARQKCVHPALRGGELTATAGGVELDLREAGTAPGGAVLDLVAFWGGIEIVVPETWEVRSELVAIVGGVDDQRRIANPGAPEGVLVLRGLVFMGGVVVRNQPSEVRVRSVRDGRVVKEVHVTPGTVTIRRERGARATRMVYGVGVFRHTDEPAGGGPAEPGAPPPQEPGPGTGPAETR